MSKVSVFEMSLRDGLQNEAVYLNLNQRFILIKKLINCGMKKMEIGAFVSPQWVPQMKESLPLVKKALKMKSAREQGIVFSALVPNEKGFATALESGIQEIAIFGSVSETFSKKNINCSVDESLKKFRVVTDLARKNKIKVRGYLSTVFGCPYEGKVDLKKVVKLVERYAELGVYEISLGDTIGVATPLQVKKLLLPLKGFINKKFIAMHFHDTRGTALANISTSLDFGVYSFDSSLGGAGGCPYAPGAAGNVATEDMVYMLEGMGVKTDLNLKKLIETTHWLNSQLGRKLPSKLSLTGAKSPIL